MTKGAFPPAYVPFFKKRNLPSQKMTRSELIKDLKKKINFELANDIE